MNRLKGIWVPVLSPQNEDCSIDMDRLFDHIDWLFSHQIHGIVLFGTNGEATSFSVAERKAVLEGIRNKGIQNEKVMVGTGCSALTDTVDLSIHALALGYTHHLILPPFYYKQPTQEGLINNYSEIIQRVGQDAFKVYLYNFPQLSGISLDGELVGHLVEKYPHNVVGYKDSSGNWNQTIEIMERNPDIIMFPGSEIFLSRVLELGGAGVITGTGNVNPGMVKKTYDAFYNEPEAAALLQEKINQFRTAVQKYPLIGALKHLMAHYRQDHQWLNLRPPLMPLSESEGAALIDSIDGIDFSLKADH